MITKKRILELLESIDELEKKMEVIYQNLYSQVSDEKYKKQFLQLSREERQHHKLVVEIKSLIEMEI